jgi:peptidoglycan hydrolase-like protein with peptidoglycan-binding domain
MSKSNYVHGGLGDFSPGQRTLKNKGKPYMEGADVKYVQRIVGVTADGLYGPQTQAAVMQFQRQKGLNPTGIVDGGTWNALQQSSSALNQLETTIDNYFDVVQSTAKGEVPENWLTGDGEEQGAISKKHIKKWVWWAGGGVLGLGLLGAMLARGD